MLRRAIALLLVLATASAAVAGWVVTRLERASTRPLTLEGGRDYHVVRPGASFAQVMRELADRGLLEHPRLLALEARYNGTAGSIKAGEYQLDSGMTPRDLIRKMIAGEVAMHAFTIVEGWTFAQLLAALRGNEIITHTLEEPSPAAVMKAIGKPDVHPEGRFFADTYHFPRGTTDVAFLRRAYDTMAGELQRAWAGRAPDLPLRNPDEALVLASIVEKETGVGHERPRIAGVFVRRLKRGMRLETDPTVIYGLGDEFDGNLTRRHLRTPTPYNTYVIQGLPPTPIALPGRDSIAAVMHPADGDALFFVARGDGEHQFSATYAEHLRAVERYQLRRRRGEGASQ
ncbi:MAG: endolytic transglycosylase MltG [Ectothiorhodospiraceae bacterium]|nr:endolytic transglycosylase MltG [Ectothiorhodospiraceae bacterium]